ncbi:MAG: peptidoglycan-binding protein, partial [Phycisphaerae bacterium]|nr:peptidoglycan-binding protein [Phycisphaerae bacterium]
EESVAVDQEHKFRRRGEPSIFRMRVVEERIEAGAARAQAAQRDGTEEQEMQAHDEPCASCPFVLEIDGEQFEGTTDAEGMLEMRIPGDARGGRLVIRPGEANELVRNVRLGRLDPISELSGVRQRLANLGFISRGGATQMTEELADAIAEFQRKNDLPATGDPDDATRERLREVHRS